LSHWITGRVAERIALAAWLMQPIGGEWRVVLEETRALGWAWPGKSSTGSMRPPTAGCSSSSFAVTGDLAEAEDALQEAYARASVRWQRLVAYDSPEAWVRRVAMNAAVSAARRARRRAVALGRLGPQPAVPELTPDALDLAAALRSIPLGQRQAVVLHHLVGLPVGEIARELGLPAGGRPAAVGVGGGSVWVADDHARLVWRIDARTNQVLGSVAVRGIVIAQDTTWPVMEVTDGTLWALHIFEAKVSRIAPHR
jgi:RNA polymerase sigma factor (sigma-70 family)